jgi:aryl-alcohol dehydrogenase-like predicted oxidoreductase
MAQKYGTGIIVRIPILFGLLAGKFSMDARFDENDHRSINLSPEKLKDYLTQLERFEHFFKKYPDYTMAQLSLRFCISHPACHVVIPGAKSPEQVRENVVASEMDFIGYGEFPGVE